MFPLQKLAELSTKTRQRKIARLIQSLEIDLGRSLPIDTAYAQGLLALLAGDPSAGASSREAALAVARGDDPALTLRRLNAVRHDLLNALQAEPAEWDLLVPETGMLDRSASRVFPIAVYLEDIRSPFNVGSIFRTSEAFAVQRIFLSPRTPLPSHPPGRENGARRRNGGGLGGGGALGAGGSRGELRPRRHIRARAGRIADR